MNIYHYSEKNGEYLGVSEAKLDPIGQNPMIPANATDQEPPTPDAKQAARWNGSAWEIVPDYRGSVWYDAEANQHKITQINQEPDPTWTSTKPVLADPVPEVVEMAQARLALLQYGYLDKVQPIIDAMPEPERTAAQIEWEYRARVRRDSALTQAIAADIPLTKQEMDQLFTTAAGL
jgi:hypothetical protein